MRAARLAIAVSGCTLLLWTVGCGPSPEQLQIQDLQERLDDCMTENDDLRSRLALLTQERDQAVARAYGLEQQVFDLRNQLRNVEQVQPESAAGWQVSGDYAWIDVGSDFLFSSGKASLLPGAKDRLATIAQQIRDNYPNKTIWVVGHTDSDPIKHSAKLWKDNLDLSLNRAAAVYRELQGMGISGDRMIAGGQGENSPKATNDTKEGKKLNRRVEIIAVPARGMQ
jgi:chemotaxis protein MotB